MESGPERGARSRLCVWRGGGWGVVSCASAGVQGRTGGHLFPVLGISSQATELIGLRSSRAGQVSDPQDGRFSGVISCSTSRMNRRHISSCQGRATHCTATGRPTLFFMAYRGHRHQDGRNGTRPQFQETRTPRGGHAAAGLGLILRRAAKACKCEDSVPYSSWVWAAESWETGRLYLLQYMVPDIPKVALVVFHLGVVLSRHSGDGHHPRREVQAVVEHSVADSP